MTDSLNHILDMLEAMLRYTEQDSDFNKGVCATLETCIQIVKAHIEDEQK